MIDEYAWLLDFQWHNAHVIAKYTLLYTKWNHFICNSFPPTVCDDPMSMCKSCDMYMIATPINLVVGV